EDGIRDRNVTGVQTCALPILNRSSHSQSKIKNRKSKISQTRATRCPVGVQTPLYPLGDCCDTPRPLSGGGASFSSSSRADPMPRSEERRVGKGCRSGGCRRWL